MHIRRASTLVWVVSAAMIAAAIGLDRGSYFPATADVWVNVGIALSFPGAGMLILGSRPGHRVGWLLSGIGLAAAVALAGHAYVVHALVLEPGSLPLGHAAAWVSAWVWALGAMPAGTLLPALFPDGRAPTLAARLAVGLGVAGVVGAVLDNGLSPGPLVDFPSVHNGIGINGAGAVLDVIGGVGMMCFLAGMVSAVVTVAIRWRRSDATGRRQLNWFGFGIVSFVAVAAADSATLLPRPMGAILAVASAAIIAGSVVLAVVRHGLYEIDVIVNRALLYATLTAFLVAVYAGGVASAGRLFGDFAGSVLSTVVVALAFDPVRRFAQRAVDRVLYGDRSEPDRAITTLAERLATAATPAAALTAVADAVVNDAGAAGARAEIVRDGHVLAASEAGTVDNQMRALPIEVAGTEVGRLLVGTSSASGRLLRRDRELLERIRGQAAAAARTVLLTADLQRSRQEAVGAREEERRRIRRDLHDGLGPRLAGLALGIESARLLVDDDPLQAVDALNGLSGDAYDTMGEVRSLLDDLRPTAVDELGLLRAIRERTAALAPSGSSLVVHVVEPDDLPPLAASVEVAAFRIALEAVTNVVRHARASTCTVRVEVGEMLELTIDDDGQGLVKSNVSGVGVSSMAERAGEVGGTFSLERLSPTGARVKARFPLKVAE